MADVRRVEGLGGETADRDRGASTGELAKERRGRFHLYAGGTPVRGLGAGMGRNDVPEQHLVLYLEAREHPVDDRRGRLGRAGAHELALGCEGDPADACAAIPRRLADEDDSRAAAPGEVGTEAVTQQRRVRVLVVGMPDLGVGQPLDEIRRRYSHSIVAGGFEVTSSTTRLTPGISFTTRAAIVSTRSYGSRAQSAVIASSLVTARITIG